MSLLFILDPLGELKAYKDSSVAMMREAARRGHDVWACLQPALRWRDGRVTATAHRLELGADDHDWYRVVETGSHELSSFDAVLMRKDPPFDSEYLYSTHLLEAAERGGARVFNAARALRDHNEKLAITEFAQFAVPTLVAREPEALRAFQAEFGDVILKPLDGMGGAGIFRVRTGDPNLNVILETITQLGTRTVMAQRYIPEIRDGDKRVLLIGGRPVPHALARIPQPGESRGNLAAGGTGRAQPLSESDLRIAAALGPVLAARGLLLVGLDVIGSHLTEINVTSPTCFVEITQQTGFDVAAMFVDALEQAVAR
ncbi:MAG: glutathione synthase [Burkholderiales bacterium]|nr:glutathione synthase [Burkholderiales bacterium]MCA3226648.1 glutathione synthase [Burkholderiales bacterium]MCE2645357.1 glutathione synthase [Burkholderiaceae bacterium]